MLISTDVEYKLDGEPTETVLYIPRPYDDYCMITIGYRTRIKQEAQ